MTWIPFEPKVWRNRDARKVVRDCAQALGSPSQALTAGAVAAIRTEHARRCGDLRADTSLLASLCCSILCDLRGQGWRIRVRSRRVEMAPPSHQHSSPEDQKARVKAAHLLERDSQLMQPPARRFIRSMERRRLHRGTWCSIFSLMRDGRGLAEQLRRAAAIPAGPMRDEALRLAIDPYIQVIGSEDVCQFTGLRLLDVWRYFRHTWTTSYLSSPGRKVWFLVRDRAAPKHPVIGIGALGSAIVQLAPRDKWIGWTSSELLEKITKAPTVRWARWVERSLSALFDAIYRKDLVSEGLIDRVALRNPTKDKIARLRRFSAEERRLHRLYPKRQAHKVAAAGGNKTNWVFEARTNLFRSKRATMLADLLEVRRLLLSAGFTKPTASALKRGLTSLGFHRAIRMVLRYIKAAHVGVDMMDITVCGAVAPYNAVLGGKLVSLLMASPDVVAAYTKRYRSAVSVIASAMAGKAVRRRPSLSLLGTTSLYEVAPAQYNRLRMSARLAGGRDGDELAFINLGRTVGFGSYHFSRETMALLELVLAQSHKGRPVNSIFGEGVNPKLRKVRTALDLLDISSDVLLQHRSRRVIYAVPMARNFRDVLLGHAARPDPIIPMRRMATKAIVAFWRSRWLSKRVERDETLVAVASHSVAYPMHHGARAVLPPLAGEEGPLFALEHDRPSATETAIGYQPAQVAALATTASVTRS